MPQSGFYGAYRARSQQSTLHSPKGCPMAVRSNRPTPEVVDRLFNEVAWAKTCLLVATTALPGPDRVRKVNKLREALKSPRHVLDEIFGRGQSVPRAVIVDLRRCELALPELVESIR